MIGDRGGASAAESATSGAIGASNGEPILKSKGKAKMNTQRLKEPRLGRCFAYKQLDYPPQLVNSLRKTFKQEAPNNEALLNSGHVATKSSNHKLSGQSGAANQLSDPTTCVSSPPACLAPQQESLGCIGNKQVVD